MTGGLKKLLPAVQKLCILLLLVWCGVAVALFWSKGGSETHEAFATGKRYIIHTKDGAIEGLLAEEAVAEKEPEPLLAPPEEVARPEELTNIEALPKAEEPIAAPSDDYTDTTAGAPLPKIGQNGQEPWRYYQKHFVRPNEQPMVAIIITDLGFSKKTTEMALATDDRVGLSFSSYAALATSWAQVARTTGHELYIDLPLQTQHYPNEDPGPYSILLARSNTENLKNLYWIMSRFQGYVGMVAPQGDVVSSNEEAFAVIREELARRGVLLIVGQANPNAPAPKDPQKEPVTLHADFWVDEELSEMSIQARLAMLEQMAQRNGYAIGLAHAYPITINEIGSWQKGLPERGLELTPPSFIAKLKAN